MIVLGFFLEISVNYMDFSMIFFLFFNVSLKCKEMENANVLFSNFPMAYY